MNPAQLDLFAAQLAEKIGAEVAHAASQAAGSAAREAVRAQTPPKLNGDPGELLKIKQVARILKCDRVHVTDLIDEGRLMAVNIASPGALKRCLRVKVAAVHAFLREQELTSTQGNP